MAERRPKAKEINIVQQSQREKTEQVYLTPCQV